MDKNKLSIILKTIYLVTGLLTIFLYFWLLPDILSVSTDKFDVYKWEDADLFIIKNVLTPLLSITVVSIVVDFALSIMNKK